MAKQAEIKHLKLKPEGNYNYNSEILLSTLSYKKLPKSNYQKIFAIGMQKANGKNYKGYPRTPS